MGAYERRTRPVSLELRVCVDGWTGGGGGGFECRM